jgi:Cytosine deaminase and related metal-dependent hy drolases
MDVALHDFALAREFGLLASMHQGGGAARTPEGWERLEAAGLLGPHINIVHGNNLSDAQLARFVDAGMSFSLTPENELTQGHGFPITGRLRKLGAMPSLGVDLESVLSGEMFIAARIALGVQRALDHAAFRAQHGEIAAGHEVSCREALAWITVAGARMLGMEDRIGSLAAGKQADLVLIDARRPNMVPLHDPVSAVVMQVSLANIDSVFVAGVARKRHGRLLVDGLPAALDALRASGERLLRAPAHA